MVRQKGKIGEIESRCHRTAGQGVGAGGSGGLPDACRHHCKKIPAVRADVGFCHVVTVKLYETQRVSLINMSDFIMDDPVKAAQVAFGQQKIDVGHSGPVPGCGLGPHLLAGPVSFPKKSAFRMRRQVILTNQLFHGREIPQLKRSVNPPGFDRNSRTVLDGGKGVPGRIHQVRMGQPGQFLFDPGRCGLIPHRSQCKENIPLNRDV